MERIFENQQIFFVFLYSNKKIFSFFLKLVTNLEHKEKILISFDFSLIPLNKYKEWYSFLMKLLFIREFFIPLKKIIPVNQFKEFHS